MACRRDDPAGAAAGAMIRVAIADDITVVGEARDGAGAVELARTVRPDVLLMDVRMPALDGIEATRRILRDPDLADVRVVVLTTYEVDDYVFEALRAGASGFLTKDVEPDDLRAAVRAVAEGNALLTPSVTRRVVNAFVATPHAAPDRSRLEVLSDRERDVLALVGQGLSNQEIADNLYRSPLTAKTHVSRMMHKLGVRDPRPARRGGFPERPGQGLTPLPRAEYCLRLPRADDVSAACPYGRIMSTQRPSVLRRLARTCYSPAASSLPAGSWGSSPCSRWLAPPRARSRTT